MDVHADLKSWHDQPAVQRLVDQFGLFFQAFGFKRNIGRIWATLFLSPRALDQAELCAMLGLSAGLISTGLRELERIGAVRVTSPPGCRRAHYEAEHRLLRTVATILTRRDLEAVLALRDAVALARQTLPTGRSKVWCHERLALVHDVTRLYEVLARLVVRVSHGPELALGTIIRALRNTRAWLPGLGASDHHHPAP
jgi:DNA-binding transcriptional regulator GbsR (MarR family)